MYYDNGFELIIEVVLAMIHFHLCEGEPLTDFLSQITCNQKRNSTDEISKSTDQKPHKEIRNGTVRTKNIQCYRTSFELEFRHFERQPQNNELSIIFTTSMEVIFETL